MMILALAATLFCGALQLPRWLIVQTPQVHYTYGVQRPLSRAVDCTGTVAANHTSEVYISAPIVAGKVPIRPGDEVKEGELLCAVDTAATDTLLDAGDTVQQLYEKYSAEIRKPKLDSEELFGIAGLDVEQLLQAYSTARKSEPVQLHYQPRYHAPISGTVTAVNICEGALFLSPEPAVVVCDLSSRRVLAQVPQRHIEQVQIGSPAAITGQGLEDESITGEVVSIAPVAQRVFSGTALEAMVEVEILVAGDHTALKPGYLVEVAIQPAAHEQVLTVPFGMIEQDSENREFVYVLGADGRAEKRLIETGRESFDVTEVCAGLSSEEMVLQPTPGLHAGSRVLLVGEIPNV